MQAQLSPEWIKFQTNASETMKELAATLKDLDKHFAGKVMAMQAHKAQSGPFRKVLTKLRTDTKLVRNALEANKTHKNEDEVEKFQGMIDNMFSEGSEVWDTHRGIMDEKKSDAYAKEALKKWNTERKKAKDKMVKKILSKSKTPVLLAQLSKTVVGIAAARRGFMGHNAKFNQAYVRFENAMNEAKTDNKKMSAALKQIEAAAKKMDRVVMGVGAS